MLSIVPGRPGSEHSPPTPTEVVPVDHADDPWGVSPREPRATGLPAPVRRAPLAAPLASDAPPAPPRRRVSAVAVVLLGLGVATLAAFAIVVWMPTGPTGTSTATTGVLILSSHPPGASVVADGTPRGTTPLALELAAGAHQIVLTASGRQGTETLQVITEAGRSSSEHVVFAPPAPTTGALSIETSRAGAEVLVDGVAVGIAPLTLQDLATGPHEVVVRVGARTVTRTVDVQAGVTTSLVLDAPAAGLQSAWLQLVTPFPVEVYEQGQLLGLSRSDRIMVSAGTHTLDLVNDDLGFRTTTTVVAPAGQTATASIEAPLAPVSINALPWAEVEIDGQRHGETPIGALMLPIGDRSVTLRHPALGVRAETFTVRLGATNRLSVSMRP